MRTMNSFLLPVFLLAFAFASATACDAAQWGAYCGPVGPIAPYMQAQVQVQTHSWKAIDGGWYHLQYGKSVLGAYHPEVGYRSWTGWQWLDPSEPPVAPPVPLAKKKSATKAEPGDDDPDPITQNFGVDESKLGGGCSYKIKDKICSRAEAIEAIEKGTLSDDSKKFRLVVIGPEPGRKKALAEIAANADAKQMLSDCIVQDYDPDHWHVAQAGFKTDGKPTIYFQKFDGKVLHRQDDFDGGAPKLFDAIRKTHPDYDPKKDPDLRKPTPNPNNPAPGPGPQPSSPTIDVSKVLPWLIVAGLGFGVLYLLPGAKKE